VTDPSSEETVGQRIRRLRRERGLSLRDLAAPGVSFTYLSRVESGQRTPSVKAIRQVARKLGVSAEYLETGVELHTREELELSLADAELAIRLEPGRRDLEPELRRIVAAAAAEGADDLATKAQVAYGLALSAWGRLDDAIAILETALAHPLATPETFVEAYTTLATAYLNAGREAEAAALCRRALAATPPHDGASRIVLATQLSSALADLGDFAGAEAVLDDLADRTHSADPYTRARMHWSFARVATMQDKRRLALSHMREAIALLTGTEDTLRLARAHLLSAQILLWGGRTEGVDMHLDAARRLLPAHAGPEDLSATAGLEALHAARSGRMREALELAEQALASEGPGHAAAWYAKGLASGEDEAFERSLELLERSSLWREASMVAEDRGRACARRGEIDAAAEWERRAADYAARVPAARSS
jgi:transcriptional regulator with XRE-family HTH domain